MNGIPAAHITECEGCPTRGNGDLCNLEDTAAKEFQKIRRNVLYQPGQFVFYEGHAALGLYILCTTAGCRNYGPRATH
jgi:hypothetical protein